MKHVEIKIEITLHDNETMTRDQLLTLLEKEVMLKLHFINYNITIE